MTFDYDGFRQKILERRDRMIARQLNQERKCRNMDYQSAFSYLTDKAKVQGRFRVAFRNRDSLHGNYAIHIHGTHVWVPKQEWDKVCRRTLSSRSNEHLNPASYTHTSPVATETHTYAIPVPGTPVMLRVYNTDVAEFTEDGRVLLRANGWQGPVTAKWLNYVRHVSIRSIRMDRWSGSKWGISDTTGTLTMFYDGLTLDQNGKIISEVQPFRKRVIDRSKSKAWHDAVRHFRDLTLPFVAMLDGGGPPFPVLETMKVCTTPYDDKAFATHILSHPQEIDPVLTTALCLPSWQGYNVAAWAGSTGDHVMHNALYRFENRLQRVYRDWVKDHALKHVA
jgi:hypothetical protein